MSRRRVRWFNFMNSCIKKHKDGDQRLNGPNLASIVKDECSVLT